MKKLLIVVDYQVDFVTGSLENNFAKEIENAVATKIDSYHKSGDDVCFTLDTHTEKYLETQEGKKLPFKHCLKGTEGHELYGKVKNARLPQDRCFEKPTFPSVTLFEYLKNSVYDQIEVCGVTTSTCVLSNVIMAKAALPEAEIIVDAKAVAATTMEIHNKALEIMENSLQITVINR